MTGVKIFVISTNIGIYLIPILRIHRIKQSKVILEMKVSVEQTNIGNTDSLLLYQNPSSQTTQYPTGVSGGV